MRKISLSFNRKDFEYDVYSLIRAFEPGCEIVTWYEEEQEPEQVDETWDRCRVHYEPDGISFSIRWGNEPVREAQVPVEYEKDRVHTKNVLKQLVYRTLSEVTGKQLPWGDLTGIRPTKIPMKLLEEGWKNTEIAEYMRNTYFTSPQKTALAITIANRERAILEPVNYENGYSLYVGIPFCPSICLYCSFGSHPLKLWENRLEEYLQAVEKELEFVSRAFAGKNLNSIYIGGGTPTTLHADQLERLLGYICSRFDLSALQEFTVEAGRPDSITKEKLQAIRRFPVDRISINPQTMHQETLDLIGRRHTVEQVIESFHLARDLGYDNINMDLIVGLPGEGEQEVHHTMEEIKALDPDSLTVHSLALKRATRLNLFKDRYREISFENSRAIMDMTADGAAAMGMRPYYLYRQKNIAGNFENVGYAKVDKAGIYNILIMEEKQTIMAVGAGASTKLVFDQGRRIERVENVKDVNHYLARIDEMIERKRAGIEKWLG